MFRSISTTLALTCSSADRELNPYFSILTVVQNSRFGFELEDWADLKGINSAIYADDEELGGERIRDQRGFGFPQ